MNETTDTATLFAANSAQPDITVSICICTRNRPSELKCALDSMARSTMRPYEIVVSDDGDDDAARLMIAKDYPGVTYVQGPRSGLGANRNCAVSVATGDHILFLDDDAMLGEEFLEKITNHLLQLPPVRRSSTIFTGIEAQGGRAIKPNDQGLLGFQSRPYRAGQPMRTVVINAAVFPGTLFREVQFDSQLIYGYDEVDITTQAVARGFEIVPCFDAINDHRQSPVNRDEYRHFTDASRLYVTLKRRRWTERSWMRGWGGFWLAALHVYLAAIKRRGLSGIRDAQRTVAQARIYHTNFVQSVNQLQHQHVRSTRISKALALKIRLHAIHSSAIKVATLGYGRVDRLVLYLIYMLMPLKTRIPWFDDRLIGVRIHHAGGSARIWLSDRSELIVLQEVLIDGEYEAVEMNQVDIIVDLGANIGISVLWFRAKYPHATIIAVEPDPRTFAKLTRNVGNDSLVRCMHAAILNTSEPVAIASSRLSWASRVDQSAGVESQMVTGITLDDLCARYALQQIDIMKVDIEGMEWSVLPVADCLARTSEVIGEIHPDMAPGDPDAFFSVIEERFGLHHTVEPSGRLFRLQRSALVSR